MSFPVRLWSLERTDRGGLGWGGRQEHWLVDSSVLTPEILQSLVRCIQVFSIIFLPFF